MRRTVLLVKNALVRALEGLLVLAVAVLVLDVLWGVASRHLLGGQSRWTEELARNLVIWVALLGASVAYATKGHLGVDFFVGKLHAETQRHDAPVLMSIGDELTNKGIEGVKIAERLARFVWEELPEIATTSDMNGYMEVMAMAPYLNVATFNNGWDGIDHHNQGRHLINRQFILEMQEKTGAIPWFVNASSGRFPFGFFFWKMTKHGVRGKVEWYYNLRNERGSLVRTDGATVYPTLDYERCREGIDDLKYLCKLESLIARANEAGTAEAERRAAQALLDKIAASIRDDWTAYRQGGERFPADGFEVMSPEKAAAMAPFDTVRRALADQIVAIQKAMMNDE